MMREVTKDHINYENNQSDIKVMLTLPVPLWTADSTWYSPGTNIRVHLLWT